MRITITLAVASLVISSNLVADSHATFIQPTSITASSTSFNTPGVLINAALGDGGADHVADPPGGGGSGTSWYTSVSHVAVPLTPVTLDFGFASPAPLELLDKLYLWDYYSHSPTDWNLKLYSGAGGSGTELLDYDFSFVTGPSGSATKHIIDFPDVSGFLSGRLETRNASVSLGVGLAEFGFTTTLPPVPEPSSLLLLGLGALGLIRHTRRRRRTE